MRQKIASFYHNELSHIKEIILPKTEYQSNHVYQLYSIRVKNGTRNDLAKSLKSAGIMSKVYFQPIHLTKFYKRCFGFKGGELPITEKIFKEILTLPLYPHMTKIEMNLVVTEVRKFFEK